MVLAVAWVRCPVDASCLWKQMTCLVVAKVRKELHVCQNNSVPLPVLRHHVHACFGEIEHRAASLQVGAQLCLEIKMCFGYCKTGNTQTGHVSPL